MEKSLGILMEDLIDYAGLFPPASLGMDAAVRNFAEYHKGPQAAWLGRFVLPAERLEEFRNAVNALDLPPDREAEAWRLSALVKDMETDGQLIEAYNRATWAGPQPSVIDTLEMKVETPEDVAAAMRDVPDRVTPYFEIPLQTPGPEIAPLLAAIARAGARAKVRTGGVTPPAIPPPEALVRFLLAAAQARVPFKATAGLHHPVRSLRKLTYAPDAPEAVMHGFLNVFLAAAFAAEAADGAAPWVNEAALTTLLKEENPAAFRFASGGVTWQGRSLQASRLRDFRKDFALSFGSCSFEEPRDDLSRAGLL